MACFQGRRAAGTSFGVPSRSDQSKRQKGLFGAHAKPLYRTRTTTLRPRSHVRDNAHMVKQGRESRFPYCKQGRC